MDEIKSPAKELGSLSYTNKYFYFTKTINGNIRTIKMFHRENDHFVLKVELRDNHLEYLFVSNLFISTSAVSIAMCYIATELVESGYSVLYLDNHNVLIDYKVYKDKLDILKLWHDCLLNKWKRIDDLIYHINILLNVKSTNVACNILRNKMVNYKWNKYYSQL